MRLLISILLYIFTLNLSYYISDVNNIQINKQLHFKERTEASGERRFQTDRNWSKPPSQKLWTGGTKETDESFLLNPSQVKIGPNENIFVLDRGDLSVKMFDKDGDYVRSTAGMRGRGPGELMNPTDFDVDDKGRIWIADPLNGKVNVYASNGAFSHDIQLERRPDRLVVLAQGNRFYTAWQSPMEEALFAQYDKEGNLQQKMGKIVDNQPERGMALDGRIAVAQDHSLYYTITRAGRLIRFDAQGEVIFDVETVDPAPIPEIIVDDRGGRRVAPSASILSLGLQVVDEEVIILSVVERGDKEDVKRAFDVYNTEGNYKHSIPLPQGTSRACITSNRIYTLMDTSLVSWKYP